MYDNEDKKWLYGKFSDAGLNIGSYEDFEKSLQNDDDKKWYHEKATSMGLNVGSYDDFNSLFGVPAAPQTNQVDDVTAQRNRDFAHQYEYAQDKVVDPRLSDSEKRQYVDFVGNYADRYEQIRGQYGRTEAPAPETQQTFRAGQRYESQANGDLPQLLKDAGLTAKDVSFEWGGGQSGSGYYTLTPEQAEIVNKTYAEKVLKQGREALIRRSYGTQIDEAMKDAAKYKEQLDAISSSVADVPAAPGAIMSPKQAALMANKDYVRTQQAYTDALDRAHTLEMMRDGTINSFWANAGEALLSPERWTFGLSSLYKAGIVADAMKNQDKETSQETLKQALLRNETEAMFANTQNNMGRWGTMTGEMAQFIILNAMGSGLFEGLGKSAEGAIRGSSDAFARKFLGKMANDLTLATLTANTIGAANTIAEALQRKQGFLDQDENGNYVFKDGEGWFKSIYGAEVNQITEYFTERLGEHFGAGAKWAAGTKLGQKLGLGSVMKFLDREPAFGLERGIRNFFKSAGINQYPGEVLEEEIGIVMSNLLQFKNPLEELKESQADILGGMAFSIGLMQSVPIGLNLAGRGYNKYYGTRLNSRLNSADKDGAAAFGDEWEGLRTRIDDTVNEDITPLIYEIAQTPEDKMSREQKRTALNYIDGLMRLRGYTTGTMSEMQRQMMQAREEAGNDLISQYGKFWTDEKLDFGDKKEHKPLQFARRVSFNGRSGYVIGEKDGKMVVNIGGGMIAFVNEDALTEDSGRVPLFVILDERSQQIKAEQEQQRMRAEAQANANALAQQAVPGATVEVGAEESKEQATVLGFENGEYVLQKADGSQIRYTPKQMADAFGLPYDPMSDAQLDAINSRVDELTNLFDQKKGKTYVFKQLGSVRGEIAGARAFVDTDGSVKVELQILAEDGTTQTSTVDADTAEQILSDIDGETADKINAKMAKDAVLEVRFEDGSTASYQYVRAESQEGETVIIGRGADGEEVELLPEMITNYDQLTGTRTDADGHPVPADEEMKPVSEQRQIFDDPIANALGIGEEFVYVTKDGRRVVNSTELWNKNPELWVKWNDQNANRITPTLDYLGNKVKALDTQVSSKQKELDNANTNGADQGTLEDLQSELRDLVARQGRIRSLYDSYAAAEQRRQEEARRAADEEALVKKIFPNLNITDPVLRHEIALAAPALERVQKLEGLSVIEELGEALSREAEGESLTPTEATMRMFSEAAKTPGLLASMMEQYAEVAESVDADTVAEKQDILGTILAENQISIENGTIGTDQSGVSADASVRADASGEGEVGPAADTAGSGGAAPVQGARNPAAVRQAIIDNAQQRLDDWNARMQSAATDEERQTLLQEKEQIIREMLDQLGAEGVVVTNSNEIVARYEQDGARQSWIDKLREKLETVRQTRQRMRGFFSLGNVYVLADYITDAMDAVTTYAHEGKHRQNASNNAVGESLQTGVSRRELATAVYNLTKSDIYDNEERDVLADEILANAAEIAERYGVDAIPQKLREAGITNEKFINFVQTNIENGRSRSNGRDLGRRDSLQPGSEEAGSRQDGSDSVAGSGALEGQGIRASEGGAPAAGRGAAAESGLDTPDENGVTPAQTREITAAVGGEMENGPATKFSVTAMAEGVGLEAIGSDEEGNVVFTGPDGTRFTGKDTITADYLKNLPNTVMGYMMADAKQLGTVTDAQADIIWQKYADMLNAFLQKGLAENGGIDNLASQWQWVAETVYKTVASNSDAQYSFSLDITRVCKKNEAVIKTIAETQRRLGYGVTPAQIMDIYLASEREGYQVPCPVCYVFSRYIRNGQYATIMINGQRKYGSRLQDPSTMTDEEKKKAIQYWRRELNRHKRNNEKHKKDITKAKGDIQSILDKIDKLGMRLLAGDVKEAESRKIMQEIRALDERYRAALQVVSQAGLDGWITQFAIHETKNGWELYDDSFQGFPEEMALDLRETATVLREYPAIQRYRNSRSAAAGKEITFEANNDIGEVPMMLGVSDLKDAPNYYKLAVQAQDDATREKMLEKAKERFVKAHIYAQRQSLRGGQRMWSWSDNIERLSPDVFVNLLQMEMLGGALQSYSKQLEGINLVARMGGYVNGSLMGKGIGYREVDEAD
ncbi:MAG: hypothetical protein J6Y27_05240, partial [Bacteroidales bacterium]|nr:hypothetical protein [Bacteroidales bacterium]